MRGYANCAMNDNHEHDHWHIRTSGDRWTLAFAFPFPFPFPAHLLWSLLFSSDEKRLLELRLRKVNAE